MIESYILLWQGPFYDQFQENDLAQADKYAEVAMSADRYNPSGKLYHQTCVRDHLQGDNDISILYLSCRRSDLQFSLILQTHALVL